MPIAGLCCSALAQADPATRLLSVAHHGASASSSPHRYFFLAWRLPPEPRALGDGPSASGCTRTGGLYDAGWCPDLAFSIGRPVRQLASPKLLTFLKDRPAHHVLLLASEAGRTRSRMRPSC